MVVGILLVYVYVGFFANSKDPKQEIFPLDPEVIVPDDVTFVIVPVVALRVVNVKTPPVRVIEGAVIAEENVVVSGEVDVLINCVFASLLIIDVEISVPFSVSVVNDP